MAWISQKLYRVKPLYRKAQWFSGCCFVCFPVSHCTFKPMVRIHLDEVLVPHDYWGSSKDLRDVWTHLTKLSYSRKQTNSNLWCLLMPLHLIKTFNHPWQTGRNLVVNVNQKVDLVKTHPTVSLSIRIFTRWNGIQVKVNSDSNYFPIISESIIIHNLSYSVVILFSGFQ